MGFYYEKNTDTDTYTVTVTFTIHLKNKGKWDKEAKKSGKSLTKWITDKLNSDINIDCFSSVESPNDICPSNRYFMKIKVPPEIKGFWVYSSRAKGLKLRTWIINKLNHGI